MQLNSVLGSLPFSPRSSPAPRRRRTRYSRALRHLDTLEPRALLSVTATAYIVPSVVPVAGAYDSSGNLWVVNESQDVNGPLLQEINASHQVVRTIDISSTNPNDMVYSNGHMYIADLNQAIDDVNLTTGTVTTYQIAADSQHTPVNITVSGDGSIWFSTFGNANADESYTNYVGHWTPGSSTADFLTLSTATSDAEITSIAGNSNDSAWVGLSGLDGSDINGAQHLVLAGFDGANFSSTVYAVNSGNALTDANNYLTSVASDGAGGVWYTLANVDTSGNGTLRTEHGADTLVHGTLAGSSLTQTSVIIYNSSPTNPVNVSNARLDSSGRVWFDELDGDGFGYYDPSAGTFTDTQYPDGTASPANLWVDPTGSAVTILTADGSGTLIHGQADASTVVTFSGSATGLTGQEGHTFSNVTLATFTAPAPVSGSYTATITWGDGTTSVVTATPAGGNTYQVSVTKAYASQGTYSGSVVITDATTTTGTLAFTSHISDTPLNVTSFSPTVLLSRIVAVTGTFTDDVGLPASTFTARVNWGDGTSSNALVVRDAAGHFLIIGLHVYKKKGTYSLLLSVTTTEANAAITNSTLTGSVTVS